MKKLFFILLTLALLGCGKTNTIYVEGTSTETAPAVDEVQEIVDAENEYRLGLGQSMLSQGLSCTVQQVAGGQWLSSSSPGYNSGQGVLTFTGSSYAFLNKSGFNQPDGPGNGTNKLIPESIRPLFVNKNFKISCTGQIVVTESGYYTFELSSDDGSILTVAGGSAIINNDGNHGVTTKYGTKYLKYGVHAFSLQYAQSGGGSFALVLKSGGEVVPGSVFYH